MQNDSWSRRSFLKTVPSVVVGLSALAHGKSGAAGVAVKWSLGTELPHTKMPPNATDCHHHIYDSHYPMAPYAVLKPGDALISDYRLLQKRLGSTRNVIIQPSTYGVDNSLLVDALRQFGLKTTRGVAVVNTSVTDAELKELDTAGVRGIRFNMAPAGATTWDMVEPLTKRITPMGWHIQIQASAADILERKDLWNRVPCPVVFDHLGHVPEPEGVNHPVFGMIADLLHKDKGWVKLSGFYNDTKIGPPTYADSVAVAAGYVKQAPERLVWGSDWPHPTEKDDNKPDDAVLLDCFAKAVPNASTRKRILVDNAAKLYGF
jgi:predicted TIM-barrel fold metal-dependent hydrolase